MSMRSTKWLFMYFVFGLVVVFGLVGCSDSTGNDSNGNSDEQVTLEFWHRWGETKQATEDTISEFEEQYPNITVELQSIPSEEELHTAISGGDLPDLFPGGTNLPVHQLHELDLLLPLGDIIGDRLDDFYEGTWTEGFTTLDGEVYTLPNFTPRRWAAVMFYNKDVLAEAGLSEEDVPTTWDELIEVSNTVYEETNGEVYGLVLGMKTYWLTERIVGTMGSAITPEVVPNDSFNLTTGEYEFNSTGIVETMDFLKDLQEEEILHPNSLVIDYREASTMFAGGKAAFVIDGTFLSPQLQTENDFYEFGVVPLPTKDGLPQYWAFQGETSAPIHVNRNTEHLEEVELFIDFFIDNFYPKLVEYAIDSSPIIEHNETIEVDNEGFTQAQAVQDDVFILTPHPYTRNINTIKVANEMSGKEPKDNLGVMLEGYLAGQVTDINSALSDLSNGYNEAFENALETIKSEGFEVDKEDYIFSDWTPLEQYSH